jgi:hypothetical protein
MPHWTLAACGFNPYASTTTQASIIYCESIPQPRRNACHDIVDIQEYLQTSFRNVFAKLAKRVAAAGELLDEAVISWDSMKEPAEGLNLWGNLNAYRSGLPLSRTPFRPFHDLKRLLTSVSQRQILSSLGSTRRRGSVLPCPG